MGLTLSAVFQLLVGIIFTIFNALSKIFDKEKPFYGIIALVALVSSLTNFAWWLADCIIFGSNKSQDGNGVYPYSDM